MRLVKLYLVMRGEAVGLLQSSGISVVLLYLVVNLIHLGVDIVISNGKISCMRRFFCCLRTANRNSSECVQFL